MAAEVLAVVRYEAEADDGRTSDSGNGRLSRLSARAKRRICCSVVSCESSVFGSRLTTEGFLTESDFA
jgi:hypothetical protein